jgi:ribosomal silencing factor RsfS
MKTALVEVRTLHDQLNTKGHDDIGYEGRSYPDVVLIVVIVIVVSIQLMPRHRERYNGRALWVTLRD